MTDEERLRWHVSWWRVLLWFPLLPLFPWWIKNRAEQTAALLELREIHLSFTLVLLLFGSVLPEIVEPVPDPPLWPVMLAGAMFLVGVGSATWVSRRPWPSETPAEVLVSIYRTKYFLQAAFAMSVAMWGFMNVFLTGWLWPYLVSGSVALVWLRVVGPTSTHIMREDRKLKVVSPSSSLVDALTGAPALGQGDPRP